MDGHDILENALAGLRLDSVFILDAHGHLGPWKAWFSHETDEEGILRSMDRIGIDTVCINAWNCPDIAEANSRVAAAVRRYPDRFVGFAATGPALGRDWNRNELKRCFDEFGFRGIKVHEGYEALGMRDRWALPEHREAMDAIWGFADERACPALCHGFLTPEVARQYPRANFIFAHAGGEKGRALSFADCPNIYFDTANSFTRRGNVEYLAEKVGVDRIVYGSDLPYADPAFRIGQVIASRLTDAQLRGILGGNMAKLLNMKERAVRG